jgi:hypothetical protein
MQDDIIWELLPRQQTITQDSRQALFYRVTSRDVVFNVMLGINEKQRCELLEHHVYDEAMPKVHPWRLLPYMQQWYHSANPPMEFATVEEAKAFVEQRIRDWETTQTNS